MSVRAVVLAAGKGTRMKSRTPKVFFELCGLPMIAHVLAAVREAGVEDVWVVAAPEARDRIAALGARAVVQEPASGTGHAMQLAMEALPNDGGAVLVVSADMPTAPPQLLREVIEKRAAASSCLALVVARVPLPTNFGRVLRNDGRVKRIVENADASPVERAIDEVNAGIYCFDATALRAQLGALAPRNAQRELYLTDCVGSIVASGGAVETVEALDIADVMGINDRAELAKARAELQRRILERHMLAGVTIVDPLSAYVDAEVRIGADTVIEPHTHLRGATTIGRGCSIGPNTMLVDSSVGDGTRIIYSIVRDSAIGAAASIGPFAHVRGNAAIEDGARIGNFVEVKKSRVGRGAKASHLSYLGDADIGEDANIGAGTITCNFDGKTKNTTKIGKRASIGSNTSLIAPVEIGDDALTGAGSVVTRDVGAGERVAGNPARPLAKKHKADRT